MIYKDILNSVIRLVIIYSCERMKILNKYADIDRGLFFLNEGVVKPKIHEFLSSNCKKLKMVINEKSDVKELFADWDEEKIEFEFLQYFWDFMQEQPIGYNTALLKECNISQKKLEAFMSRLMAEVKQVRSDYELLDDYYEFAEQFSVSSLLSKDKLNESIFTYYRIFYELETKKPQLSMKEVNELFLKFIQQVPYYSPFIRKYLTTFSREPHHLSLTVPLNFSQGMLLDTLFHFLFQFIQELFYVGYFKVDLMSEKSPKELKLKDLYEQQQINRFEETTRIMNALFNSLPNELLKSYKASVSNKSIDITLISLLFELCQSQFENDVLFYYEYYETSFLKDLYEIAPNEIGENSKMKATQMNKVFFKFMKRGFEAQGFTVDIKTAGASDQWTLKIAYGKEKFLEMTGEQIRMNHKNRNLKKMFNYE
ncbi:MAG: hypothetical protein RSB22_08315 [Acinetobacter sp.]